jgi:hypothetical protein
MGRTALQIALEHDVSEAIVTAGVVAVFETDHDDGIRLQVASAPTSDWFMRGQIAGLPCWLRKPLPSMDPTNPIGKASELHGRHHRRDWPATAAEQRANEARVERFRRSLKHSCWTRPQAWAWPARRARSSGRTAVCRLRRTTARSLDIRASRTSDIRRRGPSRCRPMTWPVGARAFAWMERPRGIVRGCSCCLDAIAGRGVVRRR